MAPQIRPLRTYVPAIKKWEIFSEYSYNLV